MQQPENLESQYRFACSRCCNHMKSLVAQVVFNGFQNSFLVGPPSISKLQIGEIIGALPGFGMSKHAESIQNRRSEFQTLETSNVRNLPAAVYSRGRVTWTL